MALGFKKVETRTWATKYRGDIAIHAAKQIPPPWLGASRHSESFRAFRDKCLLMERDTDLPRGVVLAIGRLVAIEETQIVRPDLTAMELAFGNYEDGRYAWFFEDVKPFKAPVPVKGNRLLWNWNGDGPCPIREDRR